MAEKGWREAIETVLASADGAMRYTDIADAIQERGLRRNFCATPQQTIAGVIATSIKEEGRTLAHRARRAGRVAPSARGGFARSR